MTLMGLAGRQRSTTRSWPRGNANRRVGDVEQEGRRLGDTFSEMESKRVLHLRPFNQRLVNQIQSTAYTTATSPSPSPASAPPNTSSSEPTLTIALSSISTHRSSHALIKRTSFRLWSNTQYFAVRLLLGETLDPLSGLRNRDAHKQIDVGQRPTCKVFKR